MDQIAPKTGFDLENAREGANREAAAESPRPMVLPQELQNDLPYIKQAPSQVALKHLSEMDTQVNTPEAQISANQEMIQQALSAMFKQEGLPPEGYNSQEAFNIAAEAAIGNETDYNRQLNERFDNIITTHEAFDQKGKRLSRKEIQDQFQFVISVLFTTGGLATTILNGPGIGTFFVAASVLRLAQTYRQAGQEIKFNQFSAPLRMKVKDTIKDAEAKIYALLDDLKHKNKKIGPEEINQIYAIVDSEARSLQFLESQLEEASPKKKKRPQPIAKAV